MDKRIGISLKYIPMDPTDNKSTLVQVMAWGRQVKQIIA